MTSNNNHCFGKLSSIMSCWGCGSKPEPDCNHQENRDALQLEDKLSYNLKNHTRLFSHKELQIATNNFSSKLGSGEFSSCYKGTLEDDTAVAVKVLKFKNADYKMDIEFMVLIKIMSKIKHQNMVTLIGCCVEDDHKIIVYEFMEGGSLAALLDDKTRELSWSVRASICLGIARGLECLHGHHAIHRDFRPSNVLVDNEYNPKIVDFGIGHVFADYSVYGNYEIPRNVGYMDPGFHEIGRLTQEGEVYGLGVLLLEVVSGRRVAQYYYYERDEENSGIIAKSIQDGMNLVKWAKQLGEKGSYREIVDPNVSECPEDEVKRFVDVALSCVHFSSKLRPKMSQVSLLLSPL